MEYKEFEAKVVEALKEHFAGCEIKVLEKTKNNGIKLRGVAIREGDSMIAPTIYISKMYDDGLSVRETIDEVITVYSKAVKGDIDISFFTDWEQAKNLICYKLINYEKNREWLEDAPHIKWLDLAICFYVNVSEFCGKLQSSFINIKNGYMNYWGTTVDDLMEVAQKNTPELKASFVMNLYDLLMRDFPEQMDDDNGDFAEEYPMYVISNIEKCAGASAILYDNYAVLDALASKFNDDLIMFPSSVHEFIVVPSRSAKEDEDREYYNGLVQTVNATELDSEDILSNHIYYYSRDERSVSQNI